MQIEPVAITQEALSAIAEIIQKKEIPDGYGLRIYLADKGISCGTNQYQLGFDKPGDTDLTYERNNITIIVKKMQAVHLAGLILDFVTEEDVSGFSFRRENQ